MYRKVETRVREKKVECETTKMAVKDLDKYHNALDRALMKYHSMKMEEINRILLELWTQTYRGNDIDERDLLVNPGPGDSGGGPPLAGGG